MRDMRRHALDGVAAADLQQLMIAGCVECEDAAAVLEALGPFGPAATGVFTFDGEDGGAIFGIPGFLKGDRPGSGELEHARERVVEVLGLDGVVNLHGWWRASC